MRFSDIKINGLSPSVIMSNLNTRSSTIGGGGGGGGGGERIYHNLLCPTHIFFVAIPEPGLTQLADPN